MNNALEQGFKELKLDRSDWKLVKFGDVAIQQKQSVDRENTHLRHYVKGEHMASEDLHLREWGELEDEYLGPAFIRYFEKGDILYGSRRTYLRKVTIAPFEGITSNTTFVIKANEEIIHKQLLPLVMLSEGFSRHSIRNSKGSVNPYVNWKDLANYEFLLPPIEIQAEIAELLWAMDEMVQKDIKLIESLKVYFQSSIHSYTLGVKRVDGYTSLNQKETKIGKIPQEWDVCTLEKYSELITNGFVGKATPYYTDSEAGIKYLQGMNVRRNRIDLKGLTYINKDFHHKQKKTQLREGDILTVQSGHIGETAVVPIDLEGANCHAVIISRLSKAEFNPWYVAYFINSPKGQVKIKGITVGTTVAHINTSELQKFYVPKPDIIEQNKIVMHLESVNKNETVN